MKKVEVLMMETSKGLGATVNIHNASKPMELISAAHAIITDLSKRSGLPTKAIIEILTEMDAHVTTASEEYTGDLNEEDIAIKMQKLGEAKK